MKKTTILRPVSAKAYAGFVERINLVFADSDRRASMLIALGKYLDGDRDNYAAGLTAECRVAFEMLRFDIDLAIARSAKARMRRSRRAETKPEDHRAEPTRQAEITNAVFCLKKITTTRRLPAARERDRSADSGPPCWPIVRVRTVRDI